PMALALGVLTQLLSSGVELGRATAVVAAMLKNAVTEPQIVAFGNNVNEDVGAGLPPEASLDARIQRLAAVLGATAGSIFSGDAVSVPASLQGGVKSTPSTPVRPRRP